MKVLILYDSVFGNTEKIALAMAGALDDSSSAIKVNDIDIKRLNEQDLLVVGSPTRGFRPTEEIAQLLKNLPDGYLKGKKAVAFDTRIPLESIGNKFFRGMVKLGGFADKVISNQLRKKGAEVLPSTGFFVNASEGPLAEGEVERAAEWIRSLVISAENRQ